MAEKKASNLFRALANETRLKILKLLAMAGCRGMRSGEIARELGVNPATASHHLFILCKSGAVEQRSNGEGRSYHIRESGGQQAIRWLSNVFAAPEESGSEAKA